jgi:hypothetical protein
MARPTVMTEEVIAKLEEAFAWGCTDIEACLWADIAPATLYQYQEKNPEFTERKAALKETPILLARSTVVKGLKNDTDLALKYLDRKKKDEFSTKTESDVKFEGAQPILVKFMDEKQEVDDTDNRDTTGV